MILIDSDALIGFLIPSDPHHSKASSLFANLHDTPLAISWETIDEVSTKLSMYYGKDVAKKLFDLIESSNVKIYYVDTVCAQQTIKIFLAQTSKNVSLTDCANIAICRNLGITHVFSFDPHYSQNGLKLLS